MPAAPWTFTVVVNGLTTESFDVPAHQLTDEAVKAMLRAIVIRHRTSTAQEMLPYYVNRRRGSISRLPMADVQPAWAPDYTAQGWSCGTQVEAIAYAMRPIDPAQASVVRALIAQGSA
jgi:hypothetical protein